MNMFQRMAWFNLGVVALTAVIGVVLFALQGARIVPGAMAVMALFSLNALFGSRKERELLDERDREILKKSVIVSSTIFWLYFVFAGTTILMLTGSRNTAEYYWYIFIIGGILIFLGTGSAALLILYRLDEEKAGKLLEIGKSITKNRAQQATWMFVLIINVLVISPFLYFFPAMGKSLPEKMFALIVMVCLGSIFFVGFKKILMDARNESYIRRAQILSLIGMGATIAIGLCLLLSIYWLFGLNWFSFNRLTFVVFCGFASGILIQPTYVLVQSLREPVDASE